MKDAIDLLEALNETLLLALFVIYKIPQVKNLSKTFITIATFGILPYWSFYIGTVSFPFIFSNIINFYSYIDIRREKKFTTWLLG